LEGVDTEHTVRCTCPISVRVYIVTLEENAAEFAALIHLKTVAPCKPCTYLLTTRDANSEEISFPSFVDQPIPGLDQELIWTEY